MKMDKWIRQAKTVFRLVFPTHSLAWPWFSSDPWHWFGGLLPFSAADLTPLESFFFYESEPGRVHIPDLK
jgi:hypothetical protein